MRCKDRYVCVILFCLFWLSFCIGQDKQTESHMKGENKKQNKKKTRKMTIMTYSRYCVKNETKNFRKMPISNCDHFERILTKTKTNKQTNNCGRSNVILHQSCSYLFLFLRFAHDHIYIYLYVHIVSSPNKQTTAAEENKRTGKLLPIKRSQNSSQPTV